MAAKAAQLTTCNQRRPEANVAYPKGDEQWNARIISLIAAYTAMKW